eukprot:3353843-Rhodomonas_salina.1
MPLIVCDSKEVRGCNNAGFLRGTPSFQCKVQWHPHSQPLASASVSSVQSAGSSLRAPYAMPGTEIAYAVSSLARAIAGTIGTATAYGRTGSREGVPCSTSG